MNKALIIGGGIVVGSLLGIAIGEGIFQIRRKISDARSVKNLMESTGISKDAAKSIIKRCRIIAETLLKINATSEKITKEINAYYSAAVKVAKKAA
jgi:hypothetical protein